MNALNFPIGVKTFDVNDGAAQISFNPTDVNFVSALYNLFAECAERYETDKDKKFENNTAFFEYVRQRDAAILGVPAGTPTSDVSYQNASLALQKWKAGYWY